MADVVSCDREAVLASAAVVAQVQVGDLIRPTPCAGWSLGQLLAHMIGQHYGFAAAAEGNSRDVAVFADCPVGASPAADYNAAAQRVIAAFAEPSVIVGEMYLPEVRNGITVPAPVAIGFHLVDYVVHGWDVARSIGVAIEFDADVLDVALSVAESVPDEAKSLDPRAPFRPGRPTASRDRLDRILALLGRAPEWTADGAP